MRRATLWREPSTDEGTFGSLLTDSAFHCKTGELPWRENANGASCIPPGLYVCMYRLSPIHGMCYHVENVPGRSGVEIHSANWMGDKAKGKKCQLLGCIAPGEGVAVLEGQKAVLQSRIALLALEAEFKREAFELLIKAA